MRVPGSGAQLPSSPLREANSHWSALSFAVSACGAGSYLIWKFREQFSLGVKQPLGCDQVRQHIDENYAIASAMFRRVEGLVGKTHNGRQVRLSLWRRDAYTAHSETLPGLVSSALLPGIGHWIQQEAPEAVTAALLDFLRTIKTSDYQSMGSP